jgi:cyclopropane fatty-acyl-phospholipid synthase-like methyltransferase
MVRIAPLACLAALAVACSTPSTHVHGGHGHHRFNDAQRWAAVFEDPERDAWQKPDEVINALALPERARVADIGAATGYFPVRIARSHPDATVYGVDIEPELISFLARRATSEGLGNLHPILGEPSDPKLPEPVDVVLLVDTYHHIEDRPAYFTRLAGSLRPGGRVAIVDFRKGVPMGPPDEHKLAPEQVISEMQQAGYRLAESPDFLPNQYMLIFVR